jgi:23S rRNA pseudouridine1911/1915/1917 synthase
MERLVVDAHEPAERLDAWLASALEITRSAAQRLISEGQVTVNGSVVASKSMKVKDGSRIEVLEAPDLKTERPPVDYAVRFEDEHLAVVAKPAGVVVHPAPGTRSETLIEALARRMPLAAASGPARPGVVHRLDKGTSGLLIVAKTDAAYQALIRMMRKRLIKRTYLALVQGKFRMPTGRIEAPIGRKERRRGMGVVASGRDAATSFEVAEETGDLSLLRVQLHTGRTHQIRVHLAHIGHPVIGDFDYGVKTAATAELLGLDRPFLHAAQLEFPHPIDDRRIEVSEDLPADLHAALEKARGLSAAG